MRRLFIALALLILPVSAWAWMNVVQLGGGVASSGEGDYSDILFYWDAETTTVNKVDSSNSVMTLEFGGALSTTFAAASSTKSFYVSSGSDRATIESIAADGFNETDGAIGFYIYFNVASRTGVQAWGQFNSDTSNSVFFSETGSTTYLKYIGGGTSITTETTRPATQQWVWVEYRWKSGGLDGGSNTTELLYDDVLQMAKTTTLPTMAEVTKFLIGLPASTFNDDMYIDQIMITNDPDNRTLYDIKDNTDM